MQITLARTVYEIEDVLSNITIVDSAVCSKHKIGTANGERKIYLCGNVEERNRFFDDFNKEIIGFICKENIVEYLNAVKNEYMKPTQEYKTKDKLPAEYEELKSLVNGKDELLEFKVKRSDVTHSGIYINQNSGNKSDANWNLIGDVALPRISRLSILKVSNNSIIKYYFKISFGIVEQENDVFEEEKKIIEKIENSKLTETEKETIILARVGQGKYRRQLLEETNNCPFTLVDDEHLLIASHIKPWKASTNSEKKDPKNGFVFTPTYDKLFDRGYISFSDDKKLMVSPWLSKFNSDRLNLQDGMVVESLPIIDDKRKTYLEYHRKYVLKKLEDL